MKRAFVYILIIAFFTVLIIFIRQSKQKAAQALTDISFTEVDVHLISRIVLSDRHGVADLRRESGHWTINNKYKAMPPKVDVLLGTLQKIAVYSPVSKIKRDAVMRELETSSTKVELFRMDEKNPFKTYYVGGNTEDSKGTYMVMELNDKKAEKPYVINIPGFTGILNVRYFTDETEWRDMEVFDYQFDEIAGASVEYPEAENQMHSFHIAVIGADSFVLRQRERTEPDSGKIYKEGIVKYLSSFSFLNAEAFENNNPNKESIINSTPFAIVTINGKNGESKKMVVYHMPLNRRSKLQFDAQGNRIPFDLDRYYATINDGQDFVIIQDFVFGKIFRKYTDFLLKK